MEEVWQAGADQTRNEQRAVLESPEGPSKGLSNTLSQLLLFRPWAFSELAPAWCQIEYAEWPTGHNKATFCTLLVVKQVQFNWSCLVLQLMHHLGIPHCFSSLFLSLLKLCGQCAGALSVPPLVECP